MVFGPNRETAWEQDINRSAVVKRADGYHLWYTGQANGHSWIRYNKLIFSHRPGGIRFLAKRDPGVPTVAAQLCSSSECCI